MNTRQNQARARRGKDTINHYEFISRKRDEDTLTLLIDLLSDLRHLVRNMEEANGESTFDAAVRISKNHFECEAEEARRGMPDDAILFSADDKDPEEITEESRCTPAPITIRKIRKAKP